MKTRVCSKCKEEKPLNLQNFSRGSNSGFSGYCKPCVKEYDKNRLDTYGPKRRERELKRKYSITYEEYDELLASQNYVCANEYCDETMPLYMDHDHATGANRELLCRWCNWALGHVRDDPIILHGLIEYLERHGK